MILVVNPVDYFQISIHALLTESDITRHHLNFAQTISIHALLTESDGIVYPDGAGPSLFQSTLSSRRATRIVRRDGTRGVISIHALLTESDYAVESAVQGQ